MLSYDRKQLAGLRDLQRRPIPQKAIEKKPRKTQRKLRRQEEVDLPRALRMLKGAAYNGELGRVAELEAMIDDLV